MMIFVFKHVTPSDNDERILYDSIDYKGVNHSIYSNFDPIEMMIIWHLKTFII